MLVGKGITYDTGGLDIKSKSNPFFILSLILVFIAGGSMVENMFVLILNLN
jgi:hypothetical protein